MKNGFPQEYSRRESNSDQRFRKPLFYPLNYRSVLDEAKITNPMNIGNFLTDKACKKGGVAEGCYSLDGSGIFFPQSGKNRYAKRIFRYALRCEALCKTHPHPSCCLIRQPAKPLQPHRRTKSRFSKNEYFSVSTWHYQTHVLSLHAF